MINIAWQYLQLIWTVDEVPSLTKAMDNEDNVGLTVDDVQCNTETPDSSCLSRSQY